MDSIRMEQISEVEAEGANGVPRKGSFKISGLSRSFGHSIGNGLRRTLIEGVSGVAVTNVKIEGIYSGYAAVPGISEDYREIQANLKGARFSMVSGLNETTVQLRASAAGRVTVANIELPDGVTAADPGHLLFSVDPSIKTPISMEITLRRGVGYVTADAFKSEDRETIALDANFSPVTGVVLAVDDSSPDENAETVTLTVSTDGSRTPEECIREAAVIIAEVYGVLGGDAAEVLPYIAPRTEPVVLKGSEPTGPRDLGELALTERLSRALKRNGVKTVEELLAQDPTKMLLFRNFGPKSLKEAIDALDAAGYSDAVEGWRKYATK